MVDGNTVNTFISWAMLLSYGTFVFMVWLFVEFSKELPMIKGIPTKYYSWLVAFILLIVINLKMGTFRWWDIVLYVLTAVLVSMQGKGMATFNTQKPDKTDTEL